MATVVELAGKGVISSFPIHQLRRPVIDSDAFERLIERLRGRVNASAFEGLDSYYRHGEYGLAIEHLCDELYEADETLPDDAVDLVREIGESMGLKRRSFELLTVHE